MLLHLRAFPSPLWRMRESVHMYTCARDQWSLRLCTQAHTQLSRCQDSHFHATTTHTHADINRCTHTPLMSRLAHSRYGNMHASIPPGVHTHHHSRLFVLSTVDNHVGRVFGGVSPRVKHFLRERTGRIVAFEITARMCDTREMIFTKRDMLPLISIVKCLF